MTGWTTLGVRCGTGEEVQAIDLRVNMDPDQGNDSVGPDHDHYSPRHRIAMVSNAK